MISLSDNTAADHLIALVGRSAVQTQVEQWSSHSELDIPFLTTRELFVLKYVDCPVLADHYLGLDTSQKAAYLSDSVDQVPLTRVQASNEPRDLDTIEWLASTTNVCRAFAGLSALSEEPGLGPIGTIMSVNDGGLQLNSTIWPTVWFKGGSEPGVLALGYFGKDSRGRSFVVTALAENRGAPIDVAATLELQNLVRAAFVFMQ